jgi:hypothetical protein
MCTRINKLSLKSKTEIKVPYAWRHIRFLLASLKCRLSFIISVYKKFEAHETSL